MLSIFSKWYHVIKFICTTHAYEVIYVFTHYTFILELNSKNEEVGNGRVYSNLIC